MLSHNEFGGMLILILWVSAFATAFLLAGFELRRRWLTLRWRLLRLAGLGMFLLATAFVTWWLAQDVRVNGPAPWHWYSTAVAWLGLLLTVWLRRKVRQPGN